MFNRIVANALAVALLVCFAWSASVSAQGADGPSLPWGDDAIVINPEMAPSEIASQIVIGVITDVTTVAPPAGGVYRVADVAIESTSKGTLSGSVQVVAQGGELNDGTRLAVSHEPHFPIGARYEFLLAPPAPSVSAVVPNAMSVVGGVAGLRPMDNSAAAQSFSDFVFTGSSHANFPASFWSRGVDGVVLDEIVGGFANWVTGPCTAARFSYLGDAAASDNDWAFRVSDGRNEVGPSSDFGAADADTLAKATWWVTPSNVIVEWDIAFNDSLTRNFNFFPLGAAGTHDLATVTRHEVGHILGLDHPSEVETVMFGSIPPDTVKQIGIGDAAGVTQLYPVHPFTDVPVLSYFERPVVFLRRSNVTQGKTATTFAPADDVTRGQMAAFLYRFAGSPPVSGTEPFSDVDSSDFFYEAVIWLRQQGITQGKTLTTFAPGDPVSRGQMAAFLHRSVGSPAVAGSEPFVDVVAGDFYLDPVVWLLQENITAGTSATTFSPGQPVTRGQMATFLYRFAGEPLAVCG